MILKRRWVHYIGDLLPPETPKDLLGGKGMSLHAMRQAGLLVPPAFVISTECCRQFLDNDEVWPEGLEDEVRENLRRLEQDTGRTFGRGPKPLLVSVRSGAAVSMPGMMDTLLNCGLCPALADELPEGGAVWTVYLQFIHMFAKIVSGIEPASATQSATLSERPSRKTIEIALEDYRRHTGNPFPTNPWLALRACIDAVFLSWNNERAIAYRKKSDIRELAGTAVTVQAMFPSHVSGIVFTRDPVNVKSERMVIEASYGLGEAVVSGDVSPDRFLVHRDNAADVQTIVGHKTHAVLALGDQEPMDGAAACLTDKQLAEIYDLAIKVEKHFGKPMDIEWGLAEGKFALLQCRPIRDIDVTLDVEIGRTEAIAKLKSLATNAKRRVWVTHNLGETLRFPTPLTWDIVRQFMSGAGGFGRLYKDLGYAPSAVVEKEGFLELVCGRIYADPVRLAQLFWGVSPLIYDIDAVLREPGLLGAAPTKLDVDAVEPDFLIKLPGIVVSMVRSSSAMRRLRKHAVERFEQNMLPGYLDYVSHKRHKDLSGLATSAVIDELEDRRARILDEFAPESLKPGFAGGMALGELTSLLSQLAGKEKGVALTATLTMALENDITIEQDMMLFRVATGEAKLDEFLDRFGHRCVGEMELMEPRWREDDSYLRQMLGRLKNSGEHSPVSMHAQNICRRQEAERRLEQTLADWGGSSFREDILHLLKEAQDLLPYRENGKYYLMMGYELLRLTILELAKRWNLGNDIFFLHWEELPRFEQDRSRLQNTIAARQIRWKSSQRVDLPAVIDSRGLDLLGIPEEFGAANELEGQPVAAGVSTGTARIVFDPREAGDLGIDYILVCPSTDPGWTPLFVNAKGLVVERGGTLSHGAIVARDFGIPAVVCPNATARIPTGATIQVDGSRGRIRILDKI